MKNQEIKEKSGLVLESFSQNELDTVFGGGVEVYLGDFCKGLLLIPDLFYASISGKRFDGDAEDKISVACGAMGIVIFVVAFEAVCYGIYKGGSAVVRKLKRKSVKKEAVSGKQNVVVS